MNSLAIAHCLKAKKPPVRAAFLFIRQPSQLGAAKRICEIRLIV
jgi:hypothetical protein